MKKVIQGLLALAVFFQWVNTFGQSLGAYPNTIIISGQNTTVIPSVQPTGVDYLFAFTNTNFSGTLSANPTTGVVYVTNALTPGTCLVTVKAFGVSTTTQNFTLTINNPICSDADFSESGLLTGFYNPVDIAIGDFNNDGKQDFITSDFSAPQYSIGLGDGNGGFSGYVSPKCSQGCQYVRSVGDVATGDLNGDGYHDALFNRDNFLGGNYYAIMWGNNVAGITKIPAYSEYNPQEIKLIFLEKGDFNNDGFPDLVTKDYSKNIIYIRFGNVVGQNIPFTKIDVGYTFYKVMIGDFNSDGNQDLAILVSGLKEIFIKLGDGLGGFSEGAKVSFSTTPFSLVIGDFNSDGKQDLVTFTNTSTTLSIRLGDGLGGFPVNTEVPLVASGGFSAMGDFNGDGNQDIAIKQSYTTKVSIMFGDGLGSFNNHKEIEVGDGYRSCAVGDFNADGIQDFAITYFNANFTGGRVSIRLGMPKLTTLVNLQGNGADIPNADYTPSASDHTDFGIVNIGSSVTRIFTIQNPGASPISISSIKSNNPYFVLDGVPESIGSESSAQFSLTFSPQIISIENDTVSILLGDCMGYYKFAVRGKTSAPVLGNYPNTTLIAGQNITITPSATPKYTKSAVAFTNTNFTGLFTVNPTTGNVSVTDAKQAGIYTVTVMAFGIDTSTQSFTLTVTNPECSEGLYNTSVNFGVGIQPSYVAVGDFNNDSKQDMVIANAGAKTVSIRLGDGMGAFTGNVDIPVGFNPSSIAIGDLNTDGIQDFVVGNFDSDNVSIKLGDGLGGFSGNLLLAVGDGPFSVAIGDFNGDRKQDLVSANKNSNNITIRLGDGLGGFGVSTHFPVGLGPNAVAIGDFNKDGILDLATANQNSNNISILMGNGIGGFGSSTNVAVGTNPFSVAIGDFNRDGMQDFANTNLGSNNVSIRLGNGLGGFSGSTTILVGTSPRSIALGDYNGDGIQDFATANGIANNISVRMGDGVGGFVGTNTVLVTGGLPLSLAMGDFNNDGIHDFATANRDSKNFSILIGKSALDLTFTWLGISADWNTPGNWSTGKVPGSCNRVVINKGVPFLPNITGINNTCFSIQLNNGATIRLGKNAKLRINGK